MKKNKVIVGGITAVTLVGLATAGILNKFINFIDNRSLIGWLTAILSDMAIYGIIAFIIIYLLFCIFDFVDYVADKTKK